MTKKKKYISLPSKFNNGATPLIMAYIGEDDPHRGDSKAAEGIGRTIAEQMKGQYVYVDATMRKKIFPRLRSIEARLRALLRRDGIPDIAIGTDTWNIKELTSKNAVYTVTSMNEYLASDLGIKDDDLVAHHLTPQLLSAAGTEFEKQYPWLPRPLIAVMVANSLGDGNDKELALYLAHLAAAYPQCTLFLCPSRRAAGVQFRVHASLSGIFGKIDKALAGKGPNHTQFNSLPLHLKRIFRHMDKQSPHSRLRGRTCTISPSYKKALSGYNPYLGLLANADHFIVAGDSYSIVSEALYTGKKVYVFEPGDDRYDRLRKRGYIVDLEDIDCLRPLPAKKIKPPDTTNCVAQAIINRYEKEIGQLNKSERPTPFIMG